MESAVHLKYQSHDTFEKKFGCHEKFFNKGGLNSPWKFQIGIQPDELLQRNFDSNRLTKILCHGWNTDGLTFSMPFVEKLFENSDLKVNIIAVDYRFVRLLDLN